MFSNNFAQLSLNFRDEVSIRQSEIQSVASTSRSPEFSKQLLDVFTQIKYAVAIWPVTGQGFQNTKWPAVLYYQ